MTGIEMDLERTMLKAKEMEDEAAKIQAMRLQNEITMKDPVDNADERSVYVGNVDYGATSEELQKHFQSCGTIHRVTIMVDKFTKLPKGFAYIEFEDPASVEISRALNESLFRGRLIKVTSKRTNIPGFNRRRGRSRYGYRGYRGHRDHPTSD
jgi:polyadenylate-binding protein 2